MIRAAVLLVIIAAVTTAHADPVVVPVTGAQYRDPAGLSAADARRQLELQEQQAADVREMRDLFRALAEKQGVPLKGTKKGPELLTVVSQHCASCHNPSKADAGLVLVNEDGKLNHLRDRDWAEVVNRVEKDSMPPKNKKRLAADEKAAFKR